MDQTLSVTGPDGKVYQFPSDASDGEIKTFFGEKPEPASALSRFGSGVAETFNPVQMVKGAFNTFKDPYGVLTNERDRYANLAKTGAKGSALEWLPMVGPSLAKAADTMRGGDYAGAAGQLTGMAIPTALTEVAGAGLRAMAPTAERLGLKLGKSVMKVRDSAAKLATSSEGGTNLDAGVDEIVRNAAQQGLLAPTVENRARAFALKNQAGKQVEAAARQAPPRPVGITDPTRLLPSTATGVQDVPLAGTFTETTGPRTAASTAGLRYQEAPYISPLQQGAGMQVGDQIPSRQFLGDQVVTPGGQRVPTGTGDALSGPGILRQQVPPTVVPGQPFDTVSRADLLGIIQDNIAEAERAMAPTTGLQSLLARASKLPEYIDRDQARDIVKSANMRLAPRYHNAINDPVAIGAEKATTRAVQDAMMTPEMGVANAQYAAMKPMALAVGHAAKRAGAREIMNLPTQLALGGELAAGMIHGGPLEALAAAVPALGLAVASHPVPQGLLAQKLFNLGHTLPTLSAHDAAIRATILSMLTQQQAKQPQ